MIAARPLLIVEGDRAQQEILVKGLSMDREFEVHVAASFSDADALLSAEDARFDAVVLGLEVPNGNGHRYCAKLRRLGHKMPIMIVAASSDEVDIVRGLEAGADDYLTKPLRLNELLARLRAQLRSFDNSVAAVFTIGHYTFWPLAKLLQDPTRNRRFRLTDKEAAILKLLYRAGAQSVTRPMLLEKVWGYSPAVETHTLETHIYRLRRKLANSVDGPLLITEPGGYRLNAAVGPEPGGGQAAHRNGQRAATTWSGRAPRSRQTSALSASGERAAETRASAVERSCGDAAATAPYSR
jgi:DNA-binding response OmpR family regulator